VNVFAGSSLTAHNNITAHNVDTSKSAALTLSYENDDNEPIDGASFSLYHVANIDDGEYQISDDFADANVDLELNSDTDWPGLASTFESYILVEDADNDAIEPVAEGKTDKDGELTFTDLDVGLYLLTGETLKSGKEEYIPSTSLISLPYVQSDGSLDYSPAIVPKYEVKALHVPTVEEDLIDMHVQKVWKDNNSYKRPGMIQVMLFKDGEKYDEVELNEKNSWYYSWSGLDPDAKWQLGEVSVPDGYTVISELEGKTFVVTNTLTTTTTTTTTKTPTSPHKGSSTPHSGKSTPLNPSNPQNPPKDTETKPNIPVDSDTPSEDSTSVDEESNFPYTPQDITEISTNTTDNPSNEPNVPANIKQNKPVLPQTGQLWWPVPLLAFAGLISLFIGAYLKKGKTDEE
jgi:hypothetical protein